MVFIYRAYRLAAAMSSIHSFIKLTLQFDAILILNV